MSVVVPCLNEERNLEYFFSRMPPGIDEIVLVDGLSQDRTVERARELWPSVRIVHQTRRGKGNALACGFQASTGDIIVMIDADGSTDPAEIPSFVKALRDGADFAKGSRFMAGGGSHDITWIRKVGNAGLSAFVNALFHTKYSDLCYGYNAFWRDTLPHMDLPEIDATPPEGRTMIWGDGFEIETLVNVRVAGGGLKITEVPSLESERIHGVSNLNAFADGRRVLRTIMTEYRSRRRLRRGKPALATARRTSVRPEMAATIEFTNVSAAEAHAAMTSAAHPDIAHAQTQPQLEINPTVLLPGLRAVTPASTPAGRVTAEEH